MNAKTSLTVLFVITLFLVSIGVAQNVAPFADAGLSRYVSLDPIQLNGTGSFDPDESRPLSYRWTQISGPSVVIVDANVAAPTIGGAILPGTGRQRTPTITGFTQTDGIQACEFELIVSDGELMSQPDTIKVFIVPDYGTNTLLLESPRFDSSKPTLIYFHGGDCITGGGSWDSWGSTAWAEKANIISFPSYGPDLSVGDARTYYRYGDMIITYLSSVAPDYKQPIQTMGFSTGGQPAIDVGVRMNLIYEDPRYAINRVTFLDATPYCRNNYSESISTFLASSVDGEQCWIDNYVSTMSGPTNFFHGDVLNFGSEDIYHLLAPWWYHTSLLGRDMNVFNHGVVAGAYWSVVGPGKNLQLASALGAQIYKYKWYGPYSSGYMELFDEPNHPGRLPEPVTLVGPVDVGIPNGAIFTCEKSENVVGYELLFGADPYRVMDYSIVSDTPTPPSEIITNFPFAETWWTIRVRDKFGSTIYADPIPINLGNMPMVMIENITTGKRHVRIQRAVDDATSGDTIVVGPGIYAESISVEGKDLTLRSTDPNDPDIVATTGISGGSEESAVTVASGAGLVLAGFTIAGEVECWHGSEPNIISCTLLGDVIVRSFAENLTTGKTYIRVSRAIEEAESGDEIVVSEGICETNLDFAGKNLIVRSMNPADPAIVAATVINGGGDTAVTFSGGETENCVLDGFTITDANTGIYCVNASPSITNCRIVGNRASGITVFEGGSLSVSNCIISGNKGAGIELGTLRWNAKESYATITNCIITGNRHQGIVDGKPTIINSIIYYNNAQIESDAAVSYSDIQGGFPGEGNVDSAPYFAEPGYWDPMETPDHPEDDVWINGDYHLQSQAGRWDQAISRWVLDDTTSPCIDAGDPNTWVGDEPLPNGNIINMGVYGGTIDASKSQ